MKIILVLLMFCGSLHGAEFRAGVARTKITPQLPIWMSGYAARTKPAESILQDLWAKALVVEDSRGGRLALVTIDLIGLPSSVTDKVTARLWQKHKLMRSQILLNTAHTHSGPVVRPNLKVLYELSPQDEQAAAQYAHNLTEDLVKLVDAAIGDMAPAEIASGNGSASFAINRRQATPNGVRIGVNPSGPVDQSVPVVRVTAPDGRLRALVFGYACHNTTLGADNYRINGDYAGFAQAELESRHPGATAMFLMLCGADQNPEPRGKLEHVQKYGRDLATAVDRALAGELRPVRPPLRTAYQATPLAFAPHSKRTFEEEQTSHDRFRQRRAKLMLDAYRGGHPVRQVSLPIQAIRMNNDFAILALGGEVVVDYALRIKREFPGQNVIVAGYSGEVMAYIPSKRILGEGGYEAVDSMIYYGQPGPFSDDIEDRIMSAVHRVMKKVGIK